MSRNLEARIRKLEAASDKGGEPIPVFCRGPDDFEAAFAKKVQWGLCRPEDRARALPYTDPAFAATRRAVALALVERFQNGIEGAPIPAFGTHEERVFMARAPQ